MIDKDLAGEKLAEEVNADILMILTDVNGAALYYGTEKETWLRNVKVEELEKYYQEGHFKAGSMGPKVLAAIRFIKNGGKRAIIAHLEKAVEALEGKTGTQVTP